MPNNIFPSNQKIADRAEKEAANYFAYYYPQEDDDSTELQSSLVNIYQTEDDLNG